MNSWRELLNTDAVIVLLHHFTNTLQQLKAQPQLSPRSLLWSSEWICYDSLLLLLLLAIDFSWKMTARHKFTVPINSLTLEGQTSFFLLHAHMLHLWSLFATGFLLSQPQYLFFPLQHFLCFSTKKIVSSIHVQEDNFSCLPPTQLLLSPQSKYASHSPRRAQ